MAKTRGCWPPGSSAKSVKAHGRGGGVAVCAAVPLSTSPPVKSIATTSPQVARTAPTKNAVCIPSTSEPAVKTSAVFKPEVERSTGDLKHIDNPSGKAGARRIQRRHCGSRN